MKSTMLLLSLALLAALAACGDPTCSTCRTPEACGNGEVCIAPTADEPGTCARTCSLTVWHVGPDWDAPCPAGVGTCPETCSGEFGVYGHCTAYPSANLPDDVGLCLDAAGGFACPE